MDQSTTNEMPDKDFRSFIRAELVDLADSICRMAKIEPLTIIYNGMTSANGRAYFTTRTIKLSDSIFEEGEDYCWAVVIHEVCHHIHHDKRIILGDVHNGHGAAFKEIETKWLAHYGMVPVYKRAYWKYLLDMDGSVLWTTWKERPVPVIPIPEDEQTSHYIHGVWVYY